MSQLSTNYDLATDTYRTTWAEPGINCETCHGPSKGHNEVMQAAPKGQVPRTSRSSASKSSPTSNTTPLCGSCHAKVSPVTRFFRPGTGSSITLIS